MGGRSGTAVWPVALAGLLVGLAAGTWAGYEYGYVARGVNEKLRRAELERRLSRLEEERAARDAETGERRREPRVRDPAAGAAEAARDGATAAPELPATVSSDASAPAAEQAARRSRVDALRASVDRLFADGLGEDALAALRELAALVPEGREAAMELAVAMNEDVQGKGALGLAVQTFYVGLADPAVRDLMAWALDNPSPADFRVMAAYSLPWTQDADTTVKQFLAALGGETDVSVQRALVANLSQMRRPEADAALAGLLADGNRDAVLRAQVATELALSADPGILGTLEQAAENDGDPRVRAAAKAALVARDPPASGFLVTGTLPTSQAEAAGLLPGDIVVSYGGRSTKTLEALRAATAEEGDGESVEIMVVRDGGEVRVLCRPGRLGVFGRSVETGGDER